jgi:phytol kinase
VVVVQRIASPIMTRTKRPGKNIKLAVFDVEGILLEAKIPPVFSGGGYLLFDAARQKGFFSFIRFAVISLFYLLRILSIETALKEAFMVLKDLDRDTLQEIFDGLVIRPGVFETARELRKRGIKIALVSYGLPLFLLQPFASRIGVEYVYAVELEMKDGRTTGKIGGIMSRKNGKVLTLSEICKLEDISPTECLVVADDRNNCPLFRACGFSIGLNSDRDLSRCADIILETENLSDVLVPLFNPTSMISESPSLTVHDFSRLLFHISGLWVPFFGMLLGIHPFLFLIISITVVYCISEFLRLTGRTIPVITSITTFSARGRELRQFVLAPVYFALGIFIVLLFFPNSFGFAGIAILTLGDSTASLGHKMGKTRFSYNKLKSLEGSLAGFLAGMLGAVLFTDPRFAVIGSFAGMLIESLPTPIDDNFTVPISAATTMYLASFLI